MKLREVGCLAAVAAGLACVACAQPAEVFVSPTGDDASVGSFESPFRTPLRARDFVRALKRKEGSAFAGATVYLRGGVYRVKETLQLNEADAGRPGAPVVWSAWKDEKPVFDGSAELPPLRSSTDARLPVGVREHVRCVDLSSAGFEGLADAAPTCGRDASDRANGSPVTDLYEDGRRLTVAEEPNVGWFRHSGGHSSNMTVRTELDGGDWTRWTREPDLMVKGYTTWCWTLLTAEVKNLDPAKKTFAFGGDLDLSHQYKGQFIDNQAFKFVNALCALDSPGEWFVDRHTGVLYVWPRGGKLVLAQFAGFFLRIDETHDIVIRGLTFQYGRGTAIGSWQSQDVTFERNVVRCFGREGLWSERTRNLIVRGNVFETFGSRALVVTGGDRETLTESGNLVQDNEFADAANRVRCPLLQVGTRWKADCGTRVVGNRFRDTQGSAICAMSVNLLVQSNLVERCVLREEDEGAFDTGGDPTYLGVRILDNVWRDIGVERPGQPRKHAEMLCGQAAVRLDDTISMVEIRGNRFVNCGSADFGAVNINSGRRNRVVGNVFENCHRKITGGDSVCFVPDGVWWHAWNPKVKDSAEFRERISRPLYRQAFPGVETLPDDPYWYEDRDNIEIGPRTETQPPTVPQASTNAAWQARHRAKLAEIAARKGRPYDFVIVGDAIVGCWETNAAVWKASFEDRGLSVLNLGFAGDRTENVLWRLANGELDGYEATNIVLLVGTEDASLGRPANVIARGIRDCVAEIRARRPEARVILHPLFPRGFNGYEYHSQHEWPRKRIDLASAMVRELADGDGVVWCDIRQKWKNAGWGVSPVLMPDGQHPSEAGYRLWGAELHAFCAMQPHVRQILLKPRYQRGDVNVRIVQPADTASWIWMPEHQVYGVMADGDAWKAQAENGTPPSWFFRFRNDFVSDGAALRFDVTADERFILYLDGREIARGPERGLVSHWYYHTYEVTGLAEGRHRLEAVCWQLGTGAPLAQLSYRGGFLLKAEGPYDPLLTTGKGDWRVAPLTNTTMTDRGTSLTFGVGNQCRIDGTSFVREEPTAEDWVRPAVVRGGVRVNEYGGRTVGWMLYPADRPDQMHAFKTPGKVVNVACDLTRPLVVPANSERDLWWDLDDYYCAYPELETSGGRGATIRWGWTESLRDAKGEKGDRGEWRNKSFSQTFTDEFRCDGRSNALFTAPWWRCGRWCRLQVKTADEPLELRRIGLVESRYPLQADAAFACADPGVDAVYRLSRRTLESCMHEMMFDCPYYEQQMYPGDTRIELQILNVLTRDARMQRFAMSVYDWDRRDNGMVAMNFPTRGTQESATYTMCWILMFGDYLLWHDDLPFLRQRMPGVRNALMGLALYENADGLLEDLPGWSFMDWVKGDQPFEIGVAPCGAPGQGCSALNNLLYLMALQSARAVDEALGESCLADHWRGKETRLAEVIRARFWDPVRGCLADTAARDRFSEHAQAMGILSGTLVGAQRTSALKALVDGRGLAPASSYFAYYLFEALTACGRADVVAQRLDAWRDFIRWGGRTAFETQHSHSRSDCHAWSASPIYFLHTAIAGVRPAEPRFGRVRIAPQPGKLAFVRTKTPCPQGEIVCDLNFADGGVTGTVTLPGTLTGDFVWKGERKSLAPGCNRLAEK